LQYEIWTKNIVLREKQKEK
jgi:hypothetical protein